MQLWSEVLQLFTEEGKKGPSGPNLQHTLGSSVLFPDFPLCHFDAWSLKTHIDIL